jgi:hypothetical protein
VVAAGTKAETSATVIILAADKRTTATSSSWRSNDGTKARTDLRGDFATIGGTPFFLAEWQDRQDADGRAVVVLRGEAAIPCFVVARQSADATA